MGKLAKSVKLFKLYILADVIQSYVSKYGTIVKHFRYK
jgi:hypothetical protein